MLTDAVDWCGDGAWGAGRRAQAADDAPGIRARASCSILLGVSWHVHRLSITPPELGGRGKMLVAVHVFRGGSAVDAGNEHGRETGGALLALSGAASDDHGTQFMYISCLLIRFNSIQVSVYLPGLMTTQSETPECSRSATNLTWHEPAL
jgi:hypothetical protein